MKMTMCGEVIHSLSTGLRVIFPQALSIVRRDTYYEIEKAGGGIELRTNGPRGLELIAVGSYAPDEKAVLQALIKDFSSDRQTVTADRVTYGYMILIEGTLTEKPDGSGGTFRLRLGGYELPYGGGGNNAVQS